MILTNRPLTSRVYKLGHVSFTFYGAYTVVVKVDGVSKTVDIINTTSGLSQIHIPNSEFSTGSRLTVEFTLSGVVTTYTINIVKTCYPEYYTLCWLNEKGGLDHYTFYCNASSKLETEKINIYSQSGLQDIAINSTFKRTVMSDIESALVRLWLSELAQSPLVYRIDTSERVYLSEYNVSFSKDIEQMSITFQSALKKKLQRL